MGVRLAQTRQILLIPPDDLVLSHGDQVLLLSNSLPTLEALSTLEIRAVRQLRLSQASDLSVVISPSGSRRARAPPPMTATNHHDEIRADDREKYGCARCW